jgi:hypothetical protein
LLIYSLIQKNSDTFASVYSSKCVTVFLNQMLQWLLKGFRRARIKPKDGTTIFVYLVKGGKFRID